MVNLNISNYYYSLTEQNFPSWEAVATSTIALIGVGITAYRTISPYFASLERRVVNTGLSYRGLLNHTRDNMESYKADWMSPASDFKLLFWTSGCDIPPRISQNVNEIYERTKKARINKNVIEKDGLNMCCWDFIFLCLLENNIVSKEQIDQICTITSCLNKEKKQHEEHFNLASAFFDSSQNYTVYRSIQDVASKPPALGDILVYFDGQNNWPSHVMLCIGNYKYLHLVRKNKGVEEGNFLSKESRVFWGEEKKIYRIPSAEISKNVKKFIEDYTDHLGYKPEKEVTDKEMDEVINTWRHLTSEEREAKEALEDMDRIKRLQDWAKERALAPC